MSNIPKIRFKGFTEEWEQRKLGEYVEIISGDSPARFCEGDINYVKVDDLNYAYKTVLQTQNKVSQNNHVKMVQAGSVIFPKRGAAILTNKVRVLGVDSYMDTNMMALSPQKLDTDFLYILLSKEGLYKIADTSTIPQINNKHIEPYEIYLPKFDEQKMIGQYFSNIDHLITLHQHKYNELTELKKYMMRKMFPGKGKKAPEIRFAGFTEEWEQRKLEEVVEDYVEKTTVEDQYPVLTSSQQKGIVLQDDYFSGERVSQNGNIGYFVIPRGYFTFRSRSDNDVFVFNRNDIVNMGIISYFYPVFKPKGVDSDFLLRRLNYGLEDQIKINSEGTGQHVLSFKKFKNIVGLFPSYEEQKKIGFYFSQMDTLLTLHQQKIDELTELKKYMLQNMFPKKEG